jgi:hypothetical protein
MAAIIQPRPRFRCAGGVTAMTGGERLYAGGGGGGGGYDGGVFSGGKLLSMSQAYPMQILWASRYLAVFNPETIVSARRFNSSRQCSLEMTKRKYPSSGPPG